MTTPKSGGTLIVATTVEAPSLEPHLEAADARTRRTVLLYENLVWMDNELKPQPQLAEEWEQTDDTTFVFKLRRGVTFHNGKELDGWDVKYSYERLIDPKVGSPGRGDLIMIDSIEVVDKYTVRFKLKYPYAAFLAAIGGRYSAVIPADYIQSGQELRFAAVGTGPFMVESWERNQRLVLKKNPNYWESGRPYLDQLVIQIIPDETNTVAALRTGRIDMAIFENPEFYLLLENEPNLVAQRYPAIRWDVFDMACDMKPTDDPRVRKAILLALDKAAIAQAATQGVATVIGGLPPAMTLYAAQPGELPNQERDIEQAKSLLRQAGYGDGAEITLRTITSYPTLVAAAQVIEANLRDVGITAKIEPVELGVWIQDFRAKAFPPTMNSWGGFADPDLAYYRHFHPEPEGEDFRRWRNQRAGELLDLGRRTYDVEQRREIYLEFQKLVAEEAPSIPLYAADIPVVSQSKVKGYVQHPSGWYYGFKDAWIES
jgi:peptide/nickel transport system substrate-binding protein